MADIESKVLEIIAAKAKVEQSTLTRATPLNTLTLDSMDFVEIVFDLEEAFDISIPYSANKPEGGVLFETIGDVVDKVASIAAESGKAAG